MFSKRTAASLTLAAGTLLLSAALVQSAGCSERAIEASAEPAVDGLREKSASPLVISQIYGGSGADDALFNRDYIELFNASDSAVSLAGLSIHFAGSVSDFSPAGSLPADAVVLPGKYFLVGFAAGEFGADVRTDASGLFINIPPVNGKVALVRDVPVDDPDAADASVQLLGCGAVRCSRENARIVDLVGYGVASDFGGNAPAPAGAVGRALHRKAGGCSTIGDNGRDFEALPPMPRRSTEAAHGVCSHSDAGPEADADIPVAVDAAQPTSDAEADAATAADAATDAASTADGGPRPVADAGHSADAGRSHTTEGTDPGASTAPKTGRGNDPSRSTVPGTQPATSSAPEEDPGCSVATGAGRRGNASGIPALVGLIIGALAVSRRRRTPSVPSGADT